MPKSSTRSRLIGAARELMIAGGGTPPSAGAVAARAGVSRLTVYHHFGSHSGLIDALREAAGPPHLGSGAGLRPAIAAACDHWATDPALFRRLRPAPEVSPAELHELAVALAANDRLRPGCSLREAEDVIAVVTSFAAFDRLHHDGRRSAAAVADVLYRMASSILAPLLA